VASDGGCLVTYGAHGGVGAEAPCYRPTGEGKQPHVIAQGTPRGKINSPSSQERPFLRTKIMADVGSAGHSHRAARSVSVHRSRAPI